MKSTLRTLLSLLALAVPALAQDPAPHADKVTLSNGDVLTGTIKTFEDGNLVFETANLGELTIELANVTNLVTANSVKLQNTDGDTVDRRIAGMDGGNLVLAGGPAGEPAAPPMPVASLAAINPPEKPAAEWTGSITLGASLFDGNTDRRSAAATANAERRTDDDRITAGLIWDYAEEKTGPSGSPWNLTQRRIFGEAQYDYFLTERSYLLANTTAEGDIFQDLDLRLTVGGGYGYQIYDEDDIKLKAEVGVTYFEEDYRSMTPDRDYVAARVAYGLDWDLTDGVKFLQDVEVFPSLEESDDIFLRKDSRLQLGLTDNMFAQLQWLLQYDNTPSPGLDRRDNRYFVQVGWSF